MKKPIKQIINYEKITAYFTGLALVITLWSFLHQTQRDIADLRERVAKVEVKIENLQDKKNGSQ